MVFRRGVGGGGMGCEGGVLWGDVSVRVGSCGVTSAVLLLLLLLLLVVLVVLVLLVLVLLVLVFLVLLVLVLLL